MQMQQAAASRAEVNLLQVRVELQADCYAGVWAKRAQQKHDFLDPGDVDQALQTASAIGDDRLQKQAQGYVVPDAFTHGTSAQRKRWFLNGFNGGKPEACAHSRVSGNPEAGSPPSRGRAGDVIV
jgi:predicted metalloprotease